MYTYSRLGLATLILGGSMSCTGPAIDDTTWSCTTQADCLDGFVCSTRQGVCVSATADAPGVTSDRIRVGMTLPLGPSAPLVGARMRSGIEAYFAYVNGMGGVDGRQLELVPVDDGGDGSAALVAVDQLIADKSVLGFLGNVGTDAAALLAPRLVAARALVFGARSGAADLRKDPPDRYVFNLRASTREEARRAVGFVTSVRTALVPGQNVGVFASATSTGELTASGRSMLDATAEALRTQHGVDAADVLAVTYRQGTIDVGMAVGQTLRWLGSADRRKSASGQTTAALLLEGSARASAAYVKSVLEEFHRIKRGTSPGLEFGLSAAEVSELLNVNEIVFVALSGVDGDELASELATYGSVMTLAGQVPYCKDVLTTQVVPPYDAGASGTLAYRDHLRALDINATPSFVGLEGYAAARLFVEGLRAHGPGLSVEGLVDTLDTLSAVDLGLGASYGFTPSSREASARVWGTRLDGDCAHESLELGQPMTVPVTPPPVDECVGGVCILTGTLTKDTMLTANRRWLLRGTVFVGDGMNRTVLTIEPGTTIIGEVNTTGVLVIRRSSQIQAVGTRERPIVFTSEKPVGMRARGDWGGVIINGRARINRCGMSPCEAFGEGGTGFFGGDDDADDSGTLRYVRIEFAGRLLSPENELNGLALQGVGSGTTIDHVQVHFGQDDGIEFFGGAVNVKYVLVTGADDDSFDWTDGWRGKAQFVIAQQYPGNGDNGIEADNYGENPMVMPRSKPTLSNVTLIGSPDSTNSDDGMLLRAGTGGLVSNTIVYGWNASCFNIDGADTFAAALAGTSTLTGELTVSRTLISCAQPFATDPTDPVALSTFFMTLNQDNQLVDPLLGAPLDVVSPNFAPRAGSPALGAGRVPSDPFFEPVDFIGGMGPGSDWTAGWTTNAQN